MDNGKVAPLYIAHQLTIALALMGTLIFGFWSARKGSTGLVVVAMAVALGLAFYLRNFRRTKLTAEAGNNTAV